MNCRTALFVALVGTMLTCWRLMMTYHQQQQHQRCGVDMAVSTPRYAADSEEKNYVVSIAVMSPSLFELQLALVAVAS